MCRSLAQGGRRCRGGKCAESRRARQRAYQARKRAAKRALQQGKSTSLHFNSLKPGFHESDLSDKDREYLSTLRERMESLEGSARTNAEDNFRANRRLVIMDHMLAEGRFDILDRGLTDEDRAYIEGLTSQQLTDHVTALRDHLNVDTLINDYGYSGTIAHDPAEKATRFIGEVVSTWMDKQVQAEMSAMTDTVNDWARVKAAGEDDARTLFEYSKQFRDRARDIGQARARALVTTLDATVGTSSELSARVDSQKKKIGQHLRDVSKLYPDSWKSSVEQKCHPLRIYASNARAHYASSRQKSEKGWIPANIPPVMIRSMQEPEVVSLHPYFDYGAHNDEVKVVIGGDPGNPDHVALNEEAARTLNDSLDELRLWTGGRRGSIKASSQARFVVETTPEGTLTLRKERFDNLPGREAVIRVHQDAPGTLAHELAHRMENGNVHIQALESRFLSRRSDGEESVKYFRDKQDFYADHFTHTYVGKVYNDGYREVLSTGMEMLLYGESGAGVGAQLTTDSHTRKGDDGRTVEDRDHLNFVLGLLFTARKSA